MTTSVGAADGPRRGFRDRLAEAARVSDEVRDRPTVHDFVCCSNLECVSS